MSDSPSHLAREAKGLHQGLKELLKSHNLWDKEVEFNRKNLRRQYLRLLLVEPYAKESKDAETHLWMQTSYQFISHYKQSLATLDRTLQLAPRHQPRQDGHGPVEYRKLMQRFRQFLAEEEKFWTQFIARYQRSFALHDARNILVALNILTNPPEPDIPNLTNSGDITGPSNPKSGRNHHSFPPEDSTPPLIPAEHDSRLAILSKAVVCLGDIARYRELYNEGGGRPKAGQEDGAAPARRGGRTRRGAVPGFDSIPRARNYDKAIQCYEQARLLVPHEGNASHQLAILAFYQNDMFNSLLHYYRALCVRQPYETASENVKKILNRALDQQTKKTKDMAQSTATHSAEQPPRLRVDQFKEKVVLLHALWRLGSDKVQMDPIAHADDVANDFMGLVSERILPIDTVSRVVVLSQGALWKHRMIRDASPPTMVSGTIPYPSSIESQILAHVIAIHRVLLGIGATELAVPPEDAAEDDLAQRITAPFRRTLPALRIASKWLVANTKYVLHAAQNDDDQGHDSTKTDGQVAREMDLFWANFTQFYSTLHRLFPADRLPVLVTPLDEDIDLKGFLPLRDLLLNGGTSNGVSADVGAQEKSNGAPLQGREKVHPNEEQLMRISDLLKDVRDLAEGEDFPIHLEGDIFVFDRKNRSKIPFGQVIQSDDDSVADQISPQIPVDRLSQHVTDQEEDAMTDTGRTDDDPVGDAFRKVLDDHGDSEGDDDGEVILWNPRTLGSPPTVTATTKAPLPTPPAVVSVTNTTAPPQTTQVSPVVSPRTVPKSSPAIVGTTAQDLLNNVMGLPRSGARVHHSPFHQAASLPQQFQQPFLFGSQNIWSTALDQNPSAAFSSIPMGMPSDVTPRQQSLNLSHSWSPPFESTQSQLGIGRHAPLDTQLPQSPRFFPQTSLSAVSPEHHRSLSLTPAVGQQMQQLPASSILSHHHQGSLGAVGLSGPSYTTAQPQVSDYYAGPARHPSIPFMDPAIVSVSTPAQAPIEGNHTRSLLAPYQHYPTGQMQQQQHLRAVQEPQHPLSRTWGIHG